MQLVPMNGEISIQQVLADIRGGDGRTFLIRFVRASKKGRGSIKTVAKAQYGVSSRNAKQLQNPKRSKTNPLHIHRGTIPLTDTESQKPITPLISHIIQFNNFKVIH